MAYLMFLEKIRVVRFKKIINTYENLDSCKIHRGHAAENLATIRKVVLQLLQHENSYQAGIGLKRFKAVNNTRYLRKGIGF